MSSGFRVKGLGFRDWGLVCVGFRRVRFKCLGFRGRGLGFRLQVQVRRV